MSAQELLLEEIKHQPEPVRPKVEAPMDSLIADTWEKIGAAPEVDYALAASCA